MKVSAAIHRTRAATKWVGMVYRLFEDNAFDVFVGATWEQVAGQIEAAYPGAIIEPICAECRKSEARGG